MHGATIKNSHFVFSTFFPCNIAVYEVMWKNVDPDRRRWQYKAAHALCMHGKATNTHSGYVIFSTTKMVTRTPFLSFTLYVHYLFSYTSSVLLSWHMAPVVWYITNNLVSNGCDSFAVGGWVMNCKGSERKLLRPDLRCHLGICPNRLRKTAKPWDWIVVPPEIRTLHRPYSSITTSVKT
jgi:hypothetical protein